MISIITAAFNAAATLQETIDSVLAQTFRDWEMLIVDDGSTDDTGKIAINASQRDSRIKCVMQKNSGAAAARNFALDTCSYPVVAFIDADDVWMPGKLERQLAFKVAFSFTAYRKFSGQHIGPLIGVPKTVDYTTLLKSRPIAFSSVMIDRDRVDVRFHELAGHEDLAAWLTILKTTNGRGLNLDLLRLRKGHASRSSNKAKAALNVWRLYRGQERLGLPEASWYFSHYALNSVMGR